jgi:hypothetical protein
MLAISKGKQKKIVKKKQQMACSPFDMLNMEQKKIKYLNIHARQMKLQTYRESQRKSEKACKLAEKG